MCVCHEKRTQLTLILSSINTVPRESDSRGSIPLGGRGAGKSQKEGKAIAIQRYTVQRTAQSIPRHPAPSTPSTHSTHEQKNQFGARIPTAGTDPRVSIHQTETGPSSSRPCPMSQVPCSHTFTHFFPSGLTFPNQR